uniref:Uncharacterized protein n=1 Tax=Lepeophtheirus salmonis TaxID=72036 RepID=A0A0K2U606_LEPSM
MTFEVHVNGSPVPMRHFSQLTIITSTSQFHLQDKINHHVLKQLCQIQALSLRIPLTYSTV